MNQQHFYEMRDNYLFIKTSGERKSLMEVVKSAENVSKLAKAHKIDKILADYTDVYFRLTVADAFNLVRLYEQRMPALQNVSLSIIVNNNTYDIGKFWEKICQRRGFNNAVFLNYDEAKDWLIKDSHCL